MDVSAQTGLSDARHEVNIAFASTGYGPLWAPAVSSWLRTVAFTARTYTIKGAGITDRQYTHTAENQLVMEFLSNPDLTHLFFTEADMILPHDAIVKLVALDKDMASGVYFLRSDTQEGRGQPCLYKKAAGVDALKAKKKNVEFQHSAVSLFPQNEPFRVDCAGLGCMLFKRHVFEKVPYPWFDLKASSETELGYGSDIYFSKRARDTGMELWIDPTVQCGQIDYYETNIDDYRWQLENNPKFAGSGYIIGAGGPGADLSKA